MNHQTVKFKPIMKSPLLCAELQKKTHFTIVLFSFVISERHFSSHNGFYNHYSYHIESINLENFYHVYGIPSHTKKMGSFNICVVTKDGILFHDQNSDELIKIAFILVRVLLLACFLFFPLNKWCFIYQQTNFS